jgi:hypothetical protein
MGGKGRKLMRQIDNDAVREQLDNLSRNPFRDVLAQLIEVAPEPAEMKEWAKRCPDRLAQAVAIWARLAGYNEKLEVEANVTAHVKDMSDLELQQRLAELERAAAPFPAPVEPPRKAPRQGKPRLVLLKQPSAKSSEADGGDVA